MENVFFNYAEYNSIVVIGDTSCSTFKVHQLRKGENLRLNALYYLMKCHPAIDAFGTFHRKLMLP